MAVAEGKKFIMDDIDKINPSFLEVFDFNSQNQYIKTETHEFSAVCPFSGLPDIATLIIEYYPDGGKCIELKSLKYYITSFRTVGLYQEGCTKKIFNDLKEILKTDRLKITTKYNVRGGFYTECIEGTL